MFIHDQEGRSNLSRDYTSGLVKVRARRKEAGNSCQNTHRKSSAAGGSAEGKHESAREAGNDRGGSLARERPERARQDEGSKQREARQHRRQPGGQRAKRAHQRACPADGGRYQAGDPQRTRPQHRAHHAADHCIERLQGKHAILNQCFSALLV